ncbi:phosphodiester glycosidase family protein [Aneurinibacillus soli]|nr:phosphodiester glycosidase family protein [Aneurinibacillus soli]
MIMALQLPSVGQAADMSLQKLSESIIGEGTVLQKYKLVSGGRSSIVYVTRADLNNQYVKVGPVYGTNGQVTVRQNVKKMADEKGAIAAINADFFRMDRKGAPFGIVLDEGKLVSSMGKINSWYSFGLLSDKTAIMSHLGFTGTVQAQDGTTGVIQGVNKEEYNPTNDKSHLDKINLYTRDFGPTSLGAIKGYDDAVEILVVDDMVKDMRVGNPTGYTIPTGGYVLWGHGAGKQYLMQHFQVGDPVTVTLQTTTDIPLDGRTLTSAVGGHVVLVKNGQALTNIPSDYISGYQPRSAFGISQDGKTVYMVAVEGSSASKGITLDEMAQLLKQLGAYNAANFDGGGSTTMVARQLGNTQTTLLNTPKGGSMRAVPTGLAIFNTAPAGEFSNFFFTNDTKTVMGKATPITVKAYDTHYQPFALDPSLMTWTANPADGTFTKNVFTPKRSGSIVITGQYGNVKKNLTLTVASLDVADMIVSPGSLGLRPNDQANVTVTLKAKNGQTYTASPDMVKLSLTPGLGVVNGLTVTAGSENKSGELVVTYKNIVRKIPVTVGTTWSLWSHLDTTTGLTYTAVPAAVSADGSFRLSTEGEPAQSGKSLRLDYNLTNSSNIDMRFAYGRFAPTIALPGKPLGMKIWVKGDASNHWLRAEVQDANGKIYYVDLAKPVNWSDWKEVEGRFPTGMAYPVSLRSLYIVDEEDSTLEPKGTLYFDDLSLEQPGGGSSVGVTPPPPPPAPSVGGFTDIAGHWAQDTLLAMYNKGIVSGVTQTTMGPELPVTRGQFVTFMDRAFGWTKTGEAQAASFTDKIPAYAKSSVNAAVAKKIVTGFPDGTFQADKPISRAEMAVIMHNALKQGYGKSDGTAKEKAAYKDEDAVPSYAKESVRILSELGYLSGGDDGRFGPTRTATRAEALVVIKRLLDNM